MGELSEVRENWEEFGRTDPLWSILTVAGKRLGRWDEREFFQAGEDEVAAVMERLRPLGLPRQRRRALDFGCGVGRLTQALAGRFDEVDGVDIAESMIERAGARNRHGARCRYLVNAREDLSAFDDEAFDFVLSIYVLQHMEPRYAERYVREFVRVLRPGGLAVFQIPTAPLDAPPLPPSAFAAELRLATPAETLTLPPGAVACLPVLVRNLGDIAWPAHGVRAVHIANHWMAEDGSMLVFDDGRAPLLHDLPPGEAAEVELEVRTPDVPGRYLLDVDLVQEGVAWFAQHGSPTVHWTVQVAHEQTGGQPAGEVPTLAGSARPLMEMHGVPAAEVTRWVEESGGRVIRAWSLQHIPDWSSRLYVATR